MQDFDLQKALAGEKLVTVSGYEVKQFRLNRDPHTNVSHPYVAEVCANGNWWTYAYTAHGVIGDVAKNPVDLRMAVDQPTKEIKTDDTFLLLTGMAVNVAKRYGVEVEDVAAFMTAIAKRANI